MKTNSLFALALVIAAAAAGCATTAQDEAAVSGSTAPLSLMECAQQRDTCLRQNPVLGLLTCPAQYAQCTATASDGIPAEVNAAVNEAARCTRAAAACAQEASTPVEAATCAEDEAQCVAAIIDVDLPNVVEGTAACIDSAVSCIRSSELTSDLAKCARALESCAVDQVTKVLPPEVSGVIDEVSKCGTDLNACIGSAETATALTACTETNAKCVAGGLGVTLPDVPISGVVNCAETAARCTLDASSIRDVNACAADLTSCAAAVGDTVGVPPVLTCGAKWTACMQRNNGNFLICAGELAGCQD